MKASLRILQRVPSIKFVGGPHPIVSHPVGAHPCAPNGMRPSANASPVASASAASNVAFQSRNNLSKRFRYRPIEEIEIEDVELGGALIN
ncbi:uncharacterized protein C5L36_0C04715 [Pichia kudriavzevii]|uniref:37S ribosomal protein YMR-31, mitochondrial n=1 Tax=Pichia kudriavzevii TaxID=4909 RepID=A0A2U9R6C9_PICKU|nr:uncharacterized protein C5L36_0C04715 [Pichia kudriavzevii]AWU76539.1 hypothetical protein C5L36_0C04715 [Pichia kudriavzevii]